MSVTINWGALGEVFLVSFGAAVGVIVLFAFGVSALAPTAANSTSAPGEITGEMTPRPATIRPQAVLCFLACALVVAYSLYLIIIK
ncbi:MAG: hypothetical protein ACRDRW_10280 [Pseudonocardiaceae bacterium]